MNPTPTVDIIATKRIDGVQHIVLIKRKNPPYGWALPGGFIDYGESCEDAAIRELFEETNLKPLKVLKQFRVFSNPERDPRQHNISIVFWGDVEGDLVPKDDANDAMLVPVFGPNRAIDKLDIVFDHKEIINVFFLGPHYR